MPSILSLLFPSCPTHIAAAAWAPVLTGAMIFIKRLTFGSLAHVGQEVGKAATRVRLPVLTNSDGDLSTAVVFPFIKTRIASAVQHTGPTAVSRCVLSDSRGSVLEECCNRSSLSLFGSQTAAALGMPAPEAISADEFLIAAIADTQPHCRNTSSVLLAESLSNNEESTETLVDQVRLKWHSEPPILGVMARAVSAAPCLSIVPQGGM